MRMARIIFALVAGALLAPGAHGIAVTLANPKRVEMTLREYLEKRPSTKSLRLKDFYMVCDAAVGSYTERKEFRGFDEIYVPIVPEAAHRDSYRVVLKVDRWELEIKDHAEDPVDPFVAKESVRGTITYGVVSWFSDRGKIEQHMNVADDWVLLEQRVKPELIPHLAALGAGLVLGAVLFALMRRFLTKPA